MCIIQGAKRIQKMEAEIVKTIKLAGVTEVIISLDQLDNTATWKMEDSTMFYLGIM